MSSSSWLPNFSRFLVTFSASTKNKTRCLSSSVTVLRRKRCFLEKKNLFHLLKSTQYCCIDIVEVDRSPRGGKVSPFSCPGAGNRPTNKKANVKSLGICERGIVIGGIEPRINRRRSFDLQSHFSFQSSTTLKNVIKERFYTRWLGMLVNPPFLIISRALFSQCLAEVCSDVAVLKYFRRVENCL